MALSKVALKPNVETSLRYHFEQTPLVFTLGI